MDPVINSKKQNKRRGRLPRIEVVDLFCGIGGLSYGMKSHGLLVLEGFDLDWTCQYAYETNTEATFTYKDIREVKGDEIRSNLHTTSAHGLTASAYKLHFSFGSTNQKTT